MALVELGAGVWRWSRDGVLLHFWGMQIDVREADLYKAETSFKYSSCLRIPFRYTQTAKAAFLTLHSEDPCRRDSTGYCGPGNGGEPEVSRFSTLPSGQS